MHRQQPPQLGARGLLALEGALQKQHVGLKPRDQLVTDGDSLAGRWLVGHWLHGWGGGWLRGWRAGQIDRPPTMHPLGRERATAHAPADSIAAQAEHDRGFIERQAADWWLAGWLVDLAGHDGQSTTSQPATPARVTTSWWSGR